MLSQLTQVAVAASKDVQNYVSIFGGGWLKRMLPSCVEVTQLSRFLFRIEGDEMDGWTVG